MSTMPVASKREPGEQEPDAPALVVAGHVTSLPPGAERPGEPGCGQRQPGGRRTEPVLLLQHQRDDRVGAEERAGEQPAQRDSRGDAGTREQRARWQQPAHGPADCRQPDDRKHHGGSGRVLAGALERGHAERDDERAQHPARIGERARALVPSCAGCAAPAPSARCRSGRTAAARGTPSASSRAG